MPDVILRGKAGVPQTKQEGNTIVVKKDIANAVLEERIPARKLKGKQAQLAVFGKAELDSKVAAAKKETAGHVSKMANEMLANSQKQMLENSEKKLAENARHMKGKVVAAKKATQTAKNATQTAKKAALQVEVTMDALSNQMGAELKKQIAEQKQHMKGKVAAANRATQAVKTAKKTAEAAAEAEIKKVQEKSATDTRKAIALNEDLLKATAKHDKDLTRIRKERNDFKRRALDVESSNSSGDVPPAPRAIPKTPKVKQEAGTSAASSRTPGTPVSRAPLTPAQRGRSKSVAR